MPTKNGYRLEWKKRKRYRWKRLLHTNTHLYYQFLSHRLSFFKVDFSIRKQTRKKSWFMMKRNSTKKKIWNACLNTLETNCVCMYYIDSFDQNENIGKKLVHQIPHHRWILLLLFCIFYSNNTIDSFRRKNTRLLMMMMMVMTMWINIFNDRIHKTITWATKNTKKNFFFFWSTQ